MRKIFLAGKEARDRVFLRRRLLQGGKMGKYRDQEQLIDQYLAQGNREAAVKLLFELVVACAKEKNFPEAEALRDRIFEVDSMALTEIIRSGEIIEEEKTEAIDKGHREIWSKLYEMLTVDEANALYFALQDKVYEPEVTVFRQGERNPRLYFVNNGRLKITYDQDGREVFLKGIAAGQIAGQECFFSDSVCTASMMTLSRVNLSYLEGAALKKWKTDFPVLPSKLQDFASRSERLSDLVKAKDLDRRALKRISLTGKVVVQLLSSSRNPVGRPFKGDISDLSVGGMCLLVRITKRETASLLLGQKLKISYTHPKADPTQEIEKQGTIVAVRFHPFEDCSFHVKFDSLLPQTQINLIESLWTAPEPVD
jgi:CRP-like cAMP-binding protein